MIQAGSRLTIQLPAGNDEVFGPEPFAAGQGFTLRIGEAIWRAVLRNAVVATDGGAVSLEIEVCDSTPAGYGAPNSSMPSPSTSSPAVTGNGS
jgi:hypothetical protein